jgi:hypothetical protein
LNVSTFTSISPSGKLHGLTGEIVEKYIAGVMAIDLITAAIITLEIEKTDVSAMIALSPAPPLYK